MKRLNSLTFKSNKMKDFALLFRQPDYGFSKFSAQEMKGLKKKWEDWAGGIAAQGRLTSICRSHSPTLHLGWVRGDARYLQA